MKKASCTIKVLYSAALLLTLGCSSAVPTAPATKTQQTPVVSTGDSTKTQDDDSADGKTAADTAATPKVEDKPATPPATPPAAPAPMAITSTAFANMAPIPVLYVARQGGGNQSPPLQWKNAPAGTGSFAIQMIDLDFANPQPLVHWMISNIPATTTQLPVNIPAGNNLAAPAEALGANQFRNYGGPNPPNLHRYEWTIYAIKAGETLNLTANSTTGTGRQESW